MLKRKYSMLAGAVLAASPLAAKAATVTFTYDFSGLSVTDATTSNVDTFTLTGSDATGYTLTVPSNAIIGNIGYKALVASNANSTLAYHGAYDSTPSSSTHHFIQPQNLGLAAFAFGATDNNSAVATMDPGAVATNAPLTEATGGTVVNGGIGSNSQAIAGGFLAATANASTAAGTAPLSYGAGTAADVFTGLNIDALAAGTAVFTPNSGGVGGQAVVNYNSGGTNSTLKPVYKNVTLTGDVGVTPATTLTVIVTPSSSGGQPIVSLVSGTASQAGYGTQLDHTTATFAPATPVADEINVVGSSSAGYKVGQATLNTAEQTGNVATTFTVQPTSGTEAYALKLSDTNPTDLATIVADINQSSATDGVTASLVAGSSYAAEFPGYQILLLGTGGLPASSDLGFDFTQETNVPGVTVTGVAAVPEPATAAGLVLGAAGLLLGRRKSRTA